jgi:hypothetical protein
MRGNKQKSVKKQRGRGSPKQTLKWLISHTAQDVMWRLKNQPTQGIVYIMGYSEIQYSQQRLTYTVDVLKDKPDDLPILFKKILENMQNFNLKPEAIFLIHSGGRTDTNQEMIIIRGVEIGGQKAMMTFDIERVGDRLLPAQQLNSTLAFSQDIDLGEINDFFKIYHYEQQKTVQSISPDLSRMSGANATNKG